MSKATTIELPEHQLCFLEEQLTGGQYASASEVVQAALRLLEAQEAKLGSLRRALVEGEQSELVNDFDAEAFLSRLHQENARKR